MVVAAIIMFLAILTERQSFLLVYTKGMKQVYYLITGLLEYMFNLLEYHLLFNVVRTTFSSRFIKDINYASLLIFQNVVVTVHVLLKMYFASFSCHGKVYEFTYYILIRTRIDNLLYVLLFLKAVVLKIAIELKKNSISKVLLQYYILLL